MTPKELKFIRLQIVNAENLAKTILGMNSKLLKDLVDSRLIIEKFLDDLNHKY
jgi:hypothetical protein